MTEQCQLTKEHSSDNYLNPPYSPATHSTSFHLRVRKDILKGRSGSLRFGFCGVLSCGSGLGCVVGVGGSLSLLWIEGNESEEATDGVAGVYCLAGS